MFIIFFKDFVIVLTLQSQFFLKFYLLVFQNNLLSPSGSLHQVARSDNRTFPKKLNILFVDEIVTHQTENFTHENKFLFLGRKGLQFFFFFLRTGRKFIFNLLSCNLCSKVWKMVVVTFFNFFLHIFYHLPTLRGKTILENKEPAVICSKQL